MNEIVGITDAEISKGHLFLQVLDKVFKSVQISTAFQVSHRHVDMFMFILICSVNHLDDLEMATTELINSNDEQLKFCAVDLYTKSTSNFLKEHN